MIRIVNSLLLSLCLVTISLGQEENYTYQRNIEGVTDTWHRIVLPEELYKQTRDDLADIRILGITTSEDTTEAPFIVRTTKPDSVITDALFKTINVATNEKGHFFTFELFDPISVNQIQLEFGEDNYDWKVNLEGSHDQTEWYTLLKDHRLVGIKNAFTDFNFSRLDFPESKYRYYRIHVPADKKPNVQSARILTVKKNPGTYRKYVVEKITFKESEKVKTTEVLINLSAQVPVCRLKIKVNEEFDFYRPVTFQYLIDSFETETGWKNNFRTIGSSVLNSIDGNAFSFRSVKSQQFKILIDNSDNPPLKIDKVEVSGYVHELVARLTADVDYFLVYGSKNARFPQYDLQHFEDKIPDGIKTIKLGDEIRISKKPKPIQQSSINENWLWTVIILIVIIMAWFTIRMMKNHQ